MLKNRNILRWFYNFELHYLKTFALNVVKVATLPKNICPECSKGSYIT
jgi:hypothetical protein